MTRGSNRRDLPTSGSGWIDYSCPVETWEYWEVKERFGREISPELRVEIAKAMFDFRRNSDERGASKEDRLDAKKIKRGLEAAAKSGAYPDPRLRQFVEIHCLHMPDATDAEKASYTLSEFTRYPDDFLMESSLANPHATLILYDTFSRHGFKALLGSTDKRYAMSPEARKNDPLETAFIEFVRRCIWKDDPSVTRSVAFCDRVHRLIGRR